MGKFSRDKGARRERQLVTTLRDAGIACEKDSRTGYSGYDLKVAQSLRAEVKARGDGAGFKTLERWLADNDLLFLWRDRRDPMVLMDFATARTLLKAYCAWHQLPYPGQDDEHATG